MLIGQELKDILYKNVVIVICLLVSGLKILVIFLVFYQVMNDEYTNEQIRHQGPVTYNPLFFSSSTF